MKLTIKKKKKGYTVNFKIPEQGHIILKQKVKDKILAISQLCEVSDTSVSCEKLSKSEAREVARKLFKYMDKRGYELKLSGDSVDEKKD